MLGFSLDLDLMGFGIWKRILGLCLYGFVCLEGLGPKGEC